jgi:hypothetical protein
MTGRGRGSRARYQTMTSSGRLPRRLSSSRRTSAAARPAFPRARPRLRSGDQVTPPRREAPPFPERDRPCRSRTPRCSCRAGQRLDPEDPGDAGLACAPAALHAARWPDLQVVAEPRPTLVRGADDEVDQARCPSLRRATASPRPTPGSPTATTAPGLRLTQDCIDEARGPGMGKPVVFDRLCGAVAARVCPARVWGWPLSSDWPGRATPAWAQRAWPTGARA